MRRLGDVRSESGRLQLLVLVCAHLCSITGVLMNFLLYNRFLDLLPTENKRTPVFSQIKEITQEVPPIKHQKII